MFLRVLVNKIQPFPPKSNYRIYETCEEMMKKI